MGVGEILETLRQVLIISDTQKRQEEDIKELKKSMIEVAVALQRISDRIEMNETHAKSDFENLAKQTKLELENLALKIQLAVKDQPPKPEPAKLASSPEQKPRRRARKT